MTSILIGWATIPLTFNSKEKTRSITTPTEVLVIKHYSGSHDEILLDLYNQSCGKHAIRTTLHVKSLKGHKNKWIHVPVNVTYKDYVKTSSLDSKTKSDSSSSDSEYELDPARKKLFQLDNCFDALENSTKT
ncbi:hypothetical protein Glove_120g218 [Diversispora epigaea]|uniref:Uncharacterized protein n=1 Tax=Diversispora epigaea TaxID=1348612 RepID=A0A397IZP7_9GLOM|nr:hypothetical protein Glove_120g218 [Diversispora epigaea]